MRATTDDYLNILQQLLPPGAAWPRDPDATLTKLLTATADGMANSHNRMADLVDESDPRITTEMLSDWEKTAGLPDKCATAATTVQERRAALVAKLTMRGGQSRQFFIDLAKILGFDVTISEFKPFTAGQSAAGDPCCGETWRFVWACNAPATTTVQFRAGASSCGEPLAKWGNELLECAITAKKPAHTHVNFTYGGN